MATARCCPADCALRSDWEDELRTEKEMLGGDSVTELLSYMKLLGHPLRLNIVLMLLKRDHCVCEFWHVFEEPQNLISYNLKKLRDGRIIDVEVSVVDTGPRAGQFITFHRDITEQNTRENALEQAKKKLSLLNTVTFADIRNALFTLAAYQQMIRGKITDEKITSLMEKEEISVQKIADSLNFAKSYQDLGMKPPLWQKVSHVFLLAISHLDFLRIRHTIQLDNLEVFADPLLEQVFMVLADNVLKHGGTATEISLHYHITDHQLTLFVEDNGNGIPENLKTTVFERGFQKKRGKGLFLAGEILGITGMSIRETGEPGKGARFEIMVPGNGYRFGKL